MEFRSLKYIAEACGGSLLKGWPESRIERVCTDSRHVRGGDLFIALAGEKFDGHDFVAQSLEKGVAAVMVERGRLPGGTDVNSPVIAVDNTRQALGRLAARYRLDFDLPIVAVAGSNGKTSTKELVASVLRQKFETVASEASFNNEIGVPATLLNLAGTTRAAVLEAGTNHPGELGPLIEMIRPKYGIITNIGREHLEFFGDLAGVAREEGRLAELVLAGGTLFLDGDSEWAGPLAARTAAILVRVGLTAKCEWQARDIRMTRQGMEFQVTAPSASYSGDYRIGLLGRHQVTNALFAIAVGATLGLTAEEVRRGLAACKPAKMRMELRDWNGVCVLNDAYNANADSMLAALTTLRDIPCDGRRVAVLGDMAELGAHSPAAHEEVGRQAAIAGIDQLIAIGKMAGLTAASARSAGLKAVIEFDDITAAADAIKQTLKAGDAVLFKASRSSRLERLAAMLEPEAKTS